MSIHPNYFFHGLLRKYITVFGDIFNNMIVYRKNGDTTIQKIVVPIQYGPKQKWLTRLRTEPTLDPISKKSSITLPRMSFEVSSFSYNPNRQINPINKIAGYYSDDLNKLSYDYSPAPWNISIDLSIMSKNESDATQIIEQILPFFKPELTISVNTLIESNSGMNFTEDISYVLTGISKEDNYEGDFLTDRTIVWILNFICTGSFYGPVIQENVIKTSNVSFFTTSNTTVTSNDALIVLSANTPDTKYTITPGLLANGSPTPYSNLSIDISLISANDNYGFCSDIE
jgi:hypothetical protein